MSSIDFNKYLNYMTQRQASDLFFSAQAPPSIKIEGARCAALRVVLPALKARKP